MLKTNVIGIDLAKNVLPICHINKHSELLSNKALAEKNSKKHSPKPIPLLLQWRNGDTKTVRPPHLNPGRSESY
jgi:hypothetical protein